MSLLRLTSMGFPSTPRRVLFPSLVGPCYMPYYFRNKNCNLNLVTCTFSTHIVYISLFEAKIMVINSHEHEPKMKGSPSVDACNQTQSNNQKYPK